MRALGGVLMGALLLAAPAGASTSGSGLYLTGAGYGHGIGMSQYGAAGYALHGASYQTILRDYYAQTTLGHVSPDRVVTVLLRTSGSALFSGATSIKGWSVHKLDPSFNYSVERAGPKLRVLVGRHLIGTFNAPLQVNGPGPLTLVGLGAYRGSLVFRPNPQGNGVMSVNAVPLDDYLRGVVAAEMPPGWPQQALDAQAVAARTYAITSRPVGADFELYDNTRSQMYEGVRAETVSSNAAVAATSGQVVEYDGAPVTTYFFSSSGGQTESVQNVFSIGPAAWLVARPDPYDDSLGNPNYRWKMSFSLHAAQAKLGRLVMGSLKGIKILQRGISPRVVRAQIVGTKGSVAVTGDQLRKVFGTPSTWVKFTTVSAHGVQTSTTPASTTTVPTTTVPTTTAPTTTVTTPTGTGTTTVSTGGGGLAQVAAVAETTPIASVLDHITDLLGFGSFRAIRYEVNGTIFPADRGTRVSVQASHGAGWTTVAAGAVAADGSYSVAVAHPGNYRVLYAGNVGPEISVS